MASYSIAPRDPSHPVIHIRRPGSNISLMSCGAVEAGMCNSALALVVDPSFEGHGLAAAAWAPQQSFTQDSSTSPQNCKPSALNFSILPLVRLFPLTKSTIGGRMALMLELYAGVACWMCPPQKHFEVLPSLRPTAAPQFQHSSAPLWAPLCPRPDTDPHHHRAVELSPAQSTSGGGSSSSHHSSRTGYAVHCGYLGAQLPSGSQRDPCCWVWQPRSWWPKDCHL